ncbi:MAG: hypothetical protein ACT4P3_04045, partial [Betaproteobacteria bacterium]
AAGGAPGRGVFGGGLPLRGPTARAPPHDPRLVLGDEPTGNLDSKTGQRIYELLRDIARERTVVVVTHAEDLARAADRILRIRDGALADGERTGIAAVKATA